MHIATKGRKPLDAEQLRKRELARVSARHLRDRITAMCGRWDLSVLESDPRDHNKAVDVIQALQMRVMLGAMGRLVMKVQSESDTRALTQVVRDLSTAAINLDRIRRPVVQQPQCNDISADIELLTASRKPDIPAQASQPQQDAHL